LRAGRFDFLLELPLPDRSARREIFRIHCRNKPLAGRVSPDSFAGDVTEGLTGADIELVCRKAATLAIREFLLAGDGPAK
jgi:transitional endoplasmic reticulum ATPase